VEYLEFLELLKFSFENTKFDKSDGFIFGPGCVEVVGCVRGEELASWEMVPEGVSNPLFLTCFFIHGFLDFVELKLDFLFCIQVRLEGLTDFCWLCEQPQVCTLTMQHIYNCFDDIH
jgi:hypothetical protein